MRKVTSTLSATHLAKSYGGRLVVKDVSIQVSAGEIVGLLGPNGAGKTTCFYMMVGLVDADAGDICLDGQSITAMPMHRRARAGIGYLPQEASIFRQLSVRDNLLAILETRADLNAPQRESLAEALLAEFNVLQLADALGQSLSGGERRRVEIARALATEPTVILLDEPFAGVDPISIADIKQVVRQLKERGIGVLITDHNVRETMDICERAYIVGEGEVIASGTPAEVLANQRVRDTYLGEHFSL
jgi:lipopolysaccharide export system ATP-binding protein